MKHIIWQLRTSEKQGFFPQLIKVGHSLPVFNTLCCLGSQKHTKKTYECFSMLCSCVLVTKCYSVVQPISAKYALCTVYCAKCALCKRCSGTAQYVHCARSALCKRCTVPYVQEVHCAQFNVCTCVRCNIWHRDGMPVHFPETNLD